MNKYTYTFTALCPMNRKTIIYTLVIETEDVIYVESIIAAAARYEVALHEQLADVLHRQLGGRQVLRAHHHGVDIETTRGPE